MRQRRRTIAYPRSGFIPISIALIENEASRIDAIVVLTPTDQHRDQLLTCISAGLPVVSEKALVCNSADAEKLKAAIDSKNGFLSRHLQLYGLSDVA